MACIWLAVIRVDFAIVTKRSWRTRAHAAIDQIVTRATVSTRIRLAVVDVQFTVLALESFATNALIRTDQVFARSTILTRRRFTFVDFLLTIRSRVALMTVAFVRITEILARSIVAQMLHVHTLALRRILARHHFHVAQFSRPAAGTNAFVYVLALYAGRSVVAWTLRTPVDVFGALFAGEAVRTVTRVVVVMIAARRPIMARL